MWVCSDTAAASKSLQTPECRREARAGSYGAAPILVLAWFQFLSYLQDSLSVVFSVTQKTAKYKSKSFLSKFFTHMKGALPPDTFPKVKL